MKKLTTIFLLISTIFTANAQKTFTSKKEALEFLKETLEPNFVKTAVVGKEDGKKFNDYNWYYDYKLTDKSLIIFRKSNDEPFDFSQKKDPATQIKFEDISYVGAANKSKKFKNTPSLIFWCNKGGGFKNRNIGVQDQQTIDMYVHYLVNIPFNNSTKNEITISVNNAINAIVKENEKVAIENETVTTEKKNINAEIELKQKKVLIKQNATEYSSLPNYKVYTEDGLQNSLPDYIEKNRHFKDKPTLVMTWGSWCNPCIKKIDEILKADLDKKYNIFLINRALEGLQSTEVFKTGLFFKTSAAIVLFDRNDEFAPMDNNSVPVFIWLDKNLKMVGLYKSYAITTALIGETLLEVEKNTKN